EWATGETRGRPPSDGARAAGDQRTATGPAVPRRWSGARTFPWSLAAGSLESWPPRRASSRLDQPARDNESLPAPAPEWKPGANTTRAHLTTTGRARSRALPPRHVSRERPE